MSRYLLYVLSRPHSIPVSSWETFYNDEHLDDLVRNTVATKGSMYATTPNPMGKEAPDSHTHLVLFETDHEKPFESAGFKSVTNTSAQFPPGASTSDVADLECRHYELVEIFDPRRTGSFGQEKPAPSILQTEIRVDDLASFRRFYRDNHIPMMAKHSNYRRAIMYQYLETSVVYGVVPESQPGHIIVVHEWDSFEGLGGAATQAALNTAWAVEMRPAIKSIKSRALKLVCMDSTQH